MDPDGPKTCKSATLLLASVKHNGRALTDLFNLWYGGDISDGKQYAIYQNTQESELC